MAGDLRTATDLIAEGVEAADEHRKWEYVKSVIDNPRHHIDAVLVACYGLGLAVALESLRRADPALADRVAGELVAMWDDGESTAIVAHEWRRYGVDSVAPLFERVFPEATP